MAEPVIDWSYEGETDPLCGTGATSQERTFAYGFATFITILIVIADRLRDEPIAPGWRLLLLIFFACDVAGGAAANMLNSCKRFYHSQPQGDESILTRAVKNARVFTAIHVQPILIAWLLGGDIWRGLLWYVLLQIGVAVVLAVPLYLQRAVATAVTVVAIVVNSEWLPLGVGLQWFMPCLFIKMTVGHAVREEPYRPSVV